MSIGLHPSLPHMHIGHTARWLGLSPTVSYQANIFINGALVSELTASGLTLSCTIPTPSERGQREIGRLGTGNISQLLTWLPMVRYYCLLLCLSPYCTLIKRRLCKCQVHTTGYIPDLRCPVGGNDHRAPPPEFMPPDFCLARVPIKEKK